MIFSPVDEDVSAPDPGCVDEVVALRDEVDDVLPRVVGRRNDQILLVLNRISFDQLCDVASAISVHQYSILEILDSRVFIRGVVT